MADACLVCMKEEVLKYMQEKILNGEAVTKDILKIVSDIKDGYSDTKFALLTIKNTQETQAQNDRDNKNLFMEEFKSIKSEKVAAELKLENEKKEAAKAKATKDEDDRKEKVKLRYSVIVAIAVVVANTIIGVYFKTK